MQKKREEEEEGASHDVFNARTWGMAGLATRDVSTAAKLASENKCSPSSNAARREASGPHCHSDGLSHGRPNAAVFTSGGCGDDAAVAGNRTFLASSPSSPASSSSSCDWAAAPPAPLLSALVQSLYRYWPLSHAARLVLGKTHAPVAETLLLLLLLLLLLAPLLRSKVEKLPSAAPAAASSVVPAAVAAAAAASAL
jgi:hypothetical protein